MLVLDNPVRVRPEARQQLMDTLQANKIPDEYGLRIGIRGGGCGASWLLGFDVPGSSDEVYNVEGVRIIIDRRHLLYVLGAEIGYEPGGFTVEKEQTSVGSSQ
ncbi:MULTISPECIES: iron-sulfur cluster assembly accessory protein [Spirosoma]|jgi:iron-sulfur cluster assembly protein|uniref:Iron-sulfur cluster assembly accessory protein n=2 Tax=Spirosoma TaxID=107 RepID=A0A6G9AZF2_9BACT|nr:MULTISPECIES: iron-sulfur cluster assembly accessory protein [Spirosoma]QHW01390.1 iron-sulfur cluster assembly accessory protein [Spirosoma endbachense]QIP17719.1 iron-sulfur cluster assembly accessory protein [Spirosoma aureum]